MDVKCQEGEEIMKYEPIYWTGRSYIYLDSEQFGDYVSKDTGVLYNCYVSKVRSEGRVSMPQGCTTELFSENWST